ncbi:tRNA modification GTPase MnmE [Rickettsiales bacterium Ac37b]|nr:tRNA modification GTPase MnmE [Rickettsiales bacterium Ac37b]
MNTIFALSTAPGKSGIAIIRISGREALSAVHYFGYEKKLTPRYATLTKLYNPYTKAVIDEALITYFPGPNSFTGEDIIELNIHGSRAVIKSIMELLSTLPNMTLAGPGEFSLRSFLNGKMDLTQIDGLRDLIDAETSLQQKQALQQMNGVLEKLYNKWRTLIIEALSLIESYIDFPDEELPTHIMNDLNNLIINLIQDISAHLNDNHRGEKLRAGLNIAIIGAPNVGKSSLLNLLAKREVAIVSHIAGTTRDVIEVQLDIAGYPMTIADTAGLRDSNDIIENEGINRARSCAEAADIKIALFDVNTLPYLDPFTLNLIDDNTICIFNKIDLCNNNFGNLPSIFSAETLPLSVSQNIGINELLKILETKAFNILTPSADAVITHTRYRDALHKCLYYLRAFNLDKPIELAAEDLRIAATELGKITGKISVDEILDQVFSKFCIGK